MSESLKAKKEKEEARGELRNIVKPGDTVYTTLRHVSRSGMSRTIDMHVLTTDANGKPWLRGIGSLAARAMLTKYDYKAGGIKVGVSGMDMGFHLVYNLGHCLWRDGFGCVGESCRSNDHRNGDRDRMPHKGTILGDCPNCQDRPGKDGLGRPCKGGNGNACSDGYLIAGKEHWHQDGGYALRHEWI